MNILKLKITIRVFLILSILTTFISMTSAVADPGPGPSICITPEKIDVYDIQAGSVGNKVGPVFFDNTGDPDVPQDKLYDFTITVAVKLSDNAYIEFTDAEISISNKDPPTTFPAAPDVDTNHPKFGPSKMWTFQTDLTLSGEETAIVYFIFNCKGLPEGYTEYDVEGWVFARSTEDHGGFTLDKINWYEYEGNLYPLHNSLDPWDARYPNGHSWNQHTWEEDDTPNYGKAQLDIFQVPELFLGSILGFLAPLMSLAILRKR